MKIEGKEYRTIWFDNNIVKIIDQTKLPHQFIIKDLKTVNDAINAIKEMQVRGAPLIGATAAYGLVLAIIEKKEAGFKIKQNRQDIILFYEGYELFEDGTCSFYLRSEQIEDTDLTLFYGLFMDIYPEQQNKLNYKKNNDQVVYNYFVFKRENTIEL